MDPKTLTSTTATVLSNLRLLFHIILPKRPAKTSGMIDKSLSPMVPHQSLSLSVPVLFGTSSKDAMKLHQAMTIRKKGTHIVMACKVPKEGERQVGVRRGVDTAEGLKGE